MTSGFCACLWCEMQLARRRFDTIFQLPPNSRNLFEIRIILKNIIMRAIDHNCRHVFGAKFIKLVLYYILKNSTSLFCIQCKSFQIQ